MQRGYDGSVHLTPFLQEPEHLISGAPIAQGEIAAAKVSNTIRAERQRDMSFMLTQMVRIGAIVRQERLHGIHAALL